VFRTGRQDCGTPYGR